MKIYKSVFSSKRLVSYNNIKDIIINIKIAYLKNINNYLINLKFKFL